MGAPITLTPALLPAITARLAVEGIPLNAIARSLALPSDIVRETLQDALEAGSITEMPCNDWPATSRRSDRLPLSVVKMSEGDLMLSCMRAFKVTRLLAAFLLVMLKREEVDKDTLHNVIENQRAARKTRPNNMETTDPKMVDVVICNLRRKLKPFGVKIETLWGHGYFIGPTSRTLATTKMAEVGSLADPNTAENRK